MSTPANVKNTPSSEVSDDDTAHRKWGFCVVDLSPEELAKLDSVARDNSAALEELMKTR